MVESMFIFAGVFFFGAVAGFFFGRKLPHRRFS